MPAMPTEGMREEAQRYRDWKDDGRDGVQHQTTDAAESHPEIVTDITEGRGRPEQLDLVAVTTVGRNGGIRAAVAASLLGLAGRSDVALVVGAESLATKRRVGW